MTAYGIFGDVEASAKLVRAALSDLLEAHTRTTPGDDFWLMIGVRNEKQKIHAQIIDWAVRNGVYHEVVTPSSKCTTYVEANNITVTPAFMLHVVDAMRREETGGKILALVGDTTPLNDVLAALAKAKDNGTEIRDLAEAGLTLILFKGDGPPAEDSEEENMAEEEVELSMVELGEIGDDPDHDDAEEAQGLLTEAAEEAGLDPDEYATWGELALALGELSPAAEETEEEEEEVETEDGGLTRESLVGKDIAEIKQLAKAAGIEGYSKMRREPLINALLGEEPATEAPAAPVKATAAKAAPAASSNGDSTLSDDDIERVAAAVVARLAAVLAH